MPLLPHLPQLPRWARFTRRVLPNVRPRPRHYDEPVLEEDERPLGCGWFDSSHELQRGLVMIEIASRGHAPWAAGA